ncbi:hypothetical protein IWX90DRAFT_290852 [Phyllosticta citrichinensis]|uniref:Uncharacterized protein n=1 Tax=Phyllosticta citrichinensis TaxID=1130410 RepID=A0ABR1XKD8_9PEZI
MSCGERADDHDGAGQRGERDVRHKRRDGEPRTIAPSRLGRGERNAGNGGDGLEVVMDGLEGGERKDSVCSPAGRPPGSWAGFAGRDDDLTVAPKKENPARHEASQVLCLVASLRLHIVSHSASERDGGVSSTTTTTRSALAKTNGDMQRLLCRPERHTSSEQTCERTAAEGEDIRKKTCGARSTTPKERFLEDKAFSFLGLLCGRPAERCLPLGQPRARRERGRTARRVAAAAAAAATTTRSPFHQPRALKRDREPAAG